MNHGSAPWIQLWTRIFENPKVIKILELQAGEAILLCFIRLLCMAGSQNRGGAIYFTDSMSFTPLHLAAMWRCKPALVQEALAVFQALGMIGIDSEGTIWILNWAKYQNEPGLAQIRERSLMKLQDRAPERKERDRELAAARKRKQRQKQKQQGTNGNVTRDWSVTGVTATPETNDSQRETVTPQNKIENKNIEEPPSVPQGGQMSFEDTKSWISKLFGRERAWSYEEEHLLNQRMPISKEHRALLSWAYTLKRDREGWAIVNGERASKSKESILTLLRDFESEIDKWAGVRSRYSAGRKKIPRSEMLLSSEEKKAALALYPKALLPDRWGQLSESVQREIEKELRTPDEATTIEVASQPSEATSAVRARECSLKEGSDV